ncbi:MAG: IclR family transcriptional regulator [Kiloniellaceae bacterium]
MAEDRVAAVERALSLLNCFADGTPQLSLADLAARTGYYKSTILRLAASLERFGYLVRAGNGAWRLGPAPARLAALTAGRGDHGEILRKALKDLRDASSHTASFYLRQGDARICRYRVNSQREIRHHLEEGARLPLALGAAGKLLLAYTEKNPEKAGENIRRDGFAVSQGERDPHIAAVAVPLFDSGGAFLGALCLSGLAAQFTAGQKERCRDLLQAAAAALQPQLL